MASVTGSRLLSDRLITTTVQCQQYNVNQIAKEWHNDLAKEDHLWPSAEGSTNEHAFDF